MKRQVRRNVFETNSSSQHSLCVIKNNKCYTSKEILDDIYLSKDKETGEENCIWDVWDRNLEFGRAPFRALGTFSGKWLYACASLVQEYNDATYKELVRIAKKYIPGLKKVKLPHMVDSFPDKDDPKNKDSDYAKEYGKTEKELIEYLDSKSEEWFDVPSEYWKSRNGDWCFYEPYTGYVDEDILSGFLEKENISLEEFITNKKYIVIQDGDEYGYWDDMKQTGLVNLDAIDHEYPMEA